MKKFFNSPILKKLFYTSAVVLGVLIVYHLIILIVRAHCAYYVGLVHTIFSILVLVIGIITTLLSLSQIIRFILNKNVKMIWFSTMISLFIVASVWGILFLNVVYCFLYEANLGPTELPTTGFYP